MRVAETLLKEREVQAKEKGNKQVEKRDKKHVKLNKC
jgi:hypothetical protein